MPFTYLLSLESFLSRSSFFASFAFSSFFEQFVEGYQLSGNLKAEPIPLIRCAISFWVLDPQSVLPYPLPIQHERLFGRCDI
jgi:hypothetical protein